MLLEAILRLLVAPGMLSAGLTPQEIKTLLEKYVVSLLKEQGLNPPAIADILARSTRWVYRVQEAPEAVPKGAEEPRETLREFILATLAGTFPRRFTPADVHRRVSKVYSRVEVETVRNLLLALRLEGWLQELRTPVPGFQTEIAYQFRAYYVELDDVAGVERRNNLWESLSWLEAALTAYALGEPTAGFGRIEVRLLEQHLPEFQRRAWATMRTLCQEFSERARACDPDESGTYAVSRGIFTFCRSA